MSHLCSTLAGKENLDLTEEEKEEADRLKKERQREEMREKLKKQKGVRPSRRDRK